MKSYLLSSLVPHAGDLGRTALGGRFAAHWLVWEPGAWSVPRSPGQTTIIAQSVEEARSGAGESLAMELTSQSRGQQRTFGRSEDCDLVINDATLSALHLVFMQGAGGDWTVREAGSTNGSWLDGQPLLQGRPQPLASGGLLKAGKVHLTFYDLEGLHQRLRLEAERRAQPGLGRKAGAVQSAGS